MFIPRKKARHIREGPGFYRRWFADRDVAFAALPDGATAESDAFSARSAR
jgi:hypothetical protein